MKKNVYWVGAQKVDRRGYGGGFNSMDSSITKRRAITIHNEGVDRPMRDRDGDVKWLADFVNRNGTFYHFIYNPVTGQWVQCAPVNVAAQALKGGGVFGTASANRAGIVNLQICFAGFGAEAVTDMKRDQVKGLGVWVDLAESWNIPLSGREDWGPSAGRGRDAWNQDGHHGHCHSPAPGEDHIDPGARFNWEQFRKWLVETRDEQQAQKKRK